MDFEYMRTLKIVIHLFIFYTGVTSTSVFVDSCYRGFQLTDERYLFVLHYDGATIVDSRGLRCTPIVKIVSDSRFTKNLCVELESVSNTCRNAVEFHYLYQSSHTCDQILQNAICKDSGEIVITFKPWQPVTDNNGDLRIKIYKRKITDARATQMEEGYITLYIGIAVCVIVVAIIAFIVVYRRRISRRQNMHANRGHYHSDEANGSATETPVCTTSAEPPSYIEAMASTGLQNNGYIDTSNNAHVQRDKSTSTRNNNEEIPEEPPPPYPGY